MTEQLYRHIKKLVPSFNTGWDAIQSGFHTRSVKKDELLLKEGDVCDTIYFVNKGCLYLFYEADGHKEVIHFALENWWITDYKTFVDSKPAVYSITAMEDTEVTFINRKDYEAILLQQPSLAFYFNQIHERAYGAALFKQKTYATVSKKDFYHYFRTTYPDLMRKMPDDIFASYMGISIEALNQLQEDFIS